MRRKIFLSLIFLSLLPTKVFSSELRNQYFCRILAEEVGKNVFNRNQKYIPNWIKPFINEELLVKEIVHNTLLDEVTIKNNKILTYSKCLFLLTLEKYADEYVSKKYEIKVVEEFNNQIKNFSF
tara:strand:+ start:238 stop:609 length:372 start_codon:yes stop_codon:yes gene_type:complete